MKIFNKLVAWWLTLPAWAPLVVLLLTFGRLYANPRFHNEILGTQVDKTHIRTVRATFSQQRSSYEPYTFKTSDNHSLNLACSPHEQQNRCLEKVWIAQENLQIAYAPTIRRHFSAADGIIVKILDRYGGFVWSKANDDAREAAYRRNNLVWLTIVQSTLSAIEICLWAIMAMIALTAIVATAKRTVSSRHSVDHNM